MDKKFILVAHRGGTEQYPQLTVEASKHSLSNGADFVEIDIRYTKDRVPVICHDDNGKSLFGISDRITDLTVEDFTKLHYVDKPEYKAFTLEKFLDSGVFPVLFHVKSDEMELDPIMELIQEKGYGNRVVMGVGSPAQVKYLKKNYAYVPVLAFAPKKEILPFCADEGADILRLWEPWTDQKAIEEIHDMGKKVWIMTGAPHDGTVGYTKSENLQKFLLMGADGLIVNEVQWARKVLSI